MAKDFTIRIIYEGWTLYGVASFIFKLGLVLFVLVVGYWIIWGF